ncbi:PAAR domain-containing protein [Fodinibius salsisoli]|uniref:PAAR domain-containing protein n=1 Tax=Fodinibius salsisoli TaxID=2820877 RepID=A0ABT3PQP4_9BACT|nr:PAAR domain-containing protein [Fodinibius salsisoli]MCW9708161.1 PAAR domain-containing protein [Fodinibius salsisoli]
MPSAVRVGDVSNHGGTVAGPGVPTVFIGGMPAAVATDLHVCPIVPPHPPSSPFPMGSTTVFIGGKPALRVGDVSGCGATAVLGEPTVQIG